MLEHSALRDRIGPFQSRGWTAPLLPAPLPLAGQVNGGCALEFMGPDELELVPGGRGGVLFSSISPAANSVITRPTLAGGAAVISDSHLTDVIM